MDKYNIFVNINYRTGKRSKRKNSSKINNVSVNSTKYMVGSGILNREGGNVVFTAKTMEEIRQITKNNPLIKNFQMNYRVALIPKHI